MTGASFHSAKTPLQEILARESEFFCAGVVADACDQAPAERDAEEPLEEVAS